MTAAEVIKTSAAGGDLMAAGSRVVGCVSRRSLQDTGNPTATGNRVTGKIPGDQEQLKGQKAHN